MVIIKQGFKRSTEYLKTLLILIVFIFSALSGSIISGQGALPQSRPKVGLVLSGGGARGIAHVGVLKVMEEAGLRPDIITGVSMGSIVGSMYALGYSADSLYKVFMKTNWDALMANKIPENKVIFHEKNNFYNNIVALPVTLKKVVLPSGLNNCQLIENTLSFYGWPAADINDFSRLPIPFMCLATDIVNYKKVKLKSGYLPDAIRASASIPSVFTPFKIDSTLLLDGGLTRNFAASEAREMGADILIGSYTGYQESNEEELQSVSGIMKQIALFRSFEDFRRERRLVNLLITPDIKEFPLTGFNNAEKIYQRGYEAALPKKEYFKRLADSLNNIAPQKKIDTILNKQYYSFDKIEVTGNKGYSDLQITGLLDILPGEQVDKYTLTDRIELLYGESWFEKVKYRIVPRNDSLILIIDCIEKPQAMLYGSVHYDLAMRSGIKLGLSVKNLLTERSTIDINSYIGQYFWIDINSTQYIGRNQKFGLSLNFRTRNRQLPMLNLSGQNGTVLSRDIIQGVSVSRRFGLNHMMNMFLNYENLNLLTRYDSNDNLKSLSYNYITEGWDYHINTLNTKHFPDKGLLLNAKISTSKLFSGNLENNTKIHVTPDDNHGEFLFDRFFTLSGNLKQYFSPSEKVTLDLGCDLLFINKTDSAQARNNFYTLGGTNGDDHRSLTAIGYQPYEIIVKSAAGVRGHFDMEFHKDLHAELMADVFLIGEAGGKKEYTLISGFGAGLGYMSVIGPIRLGIMFGGHSNTELFNKTKGYLSIGFNF
jgi:NTE family protein